MEMKNYLRKIKTALGTNTDLIDLEIDDDELTNIVNDSLDDMKPYISTTKLMTLPYTKVIDLKDKGVYNVYQVFRGTPTGPVNTEGVPDEAMLFGGSGAGNLLMTGDYSINGHTVDMFEQVNLRLAANMYQNALRGLNDVDFTYSDHKLYVDLSKTTPSITIEYSPLYQDVDELTDAYWERKLKDLAIANSKIVLGRIRSKYTLDGNSYTLDGETLLTEGREERTALMEEFTTSASEVLQILD